MIKICDECGKEYPVPLSRAMESRFCKRSCFNAYRKKNPEQFSKKSHDHNDYKDPNREFTQLTLTLVAVAELDGVKMSKIIKDCKWHELRFYQQLDLNREKVDLRKKLVTARRKQPINIDHFMYGYKLAKEEDMDFINKGVT